MTNHATTVQIDPTETSVQIELVDVHSDYYFISPGQALEDTQEVGK